MKSILTEPPSKVELLISMRAEALAMAAAEADAENPACDPLIAEQDYDEAAARLLALFEASEEIGLMNELQQFLTVTYGG